MSYRRMRPGLGTFLTIQIENPVQFKTEQLDTWVNEAFEEAERLEQIFSKFRPDSMLYRVNNTEVGIWVAISEELSDVLSFSLRLWRLSLGAFNPFFPLRFRQCPIVFLRSRLKKIEPLTLDLNGVAKGYIVDRLVGLLSKKEPRLKGVVNAGGDLRYLNVDHRLNQVQVGEHLIALEHISGLASVATSSPREIRSRSTAVYLPSGRHTATAIAENCMSADAMTKVGLFAEREQIESCARELNAKVWLYEDV